ncbi:MAG: hypothetical protein K2X45_11595 [Phreatobacter sp.]|nr:hypothetical protein [Phreatobacter sp.]
MFLLLGTAIVIMITAWVTWSFWLRIPLDNNRGEEVLAAAMYGRHADINNDCALRRPNCVFNGVPIQSRNEAAFGNNGIAMRGRMVTFITDDGSRLVTAGLVDDPTRPTSDGAAGTRGMASARIVAHLAHLRRSNAPEAPWRTGIYDGAGQIAFSDREAFPASVPGTQPILATGAGYTLPAGTPMIVSPIPRGFLGP